MGPIRNNFHVSSSIAFETILWVHYEVQKLRCSFVSGKKETDISIATGSSNIGKKIIGINKTQGNQEMEVKAESSFF